MIALSDATFPSANRFGYISCSSEPSPVTGVPVRIEIQKSMMIGDIIELVTQGYSTAHGLQPVPGTDFKVVHMIDSIVGERFVDLNVEPYATKIKPIGSGSLDARYSVIRDGNVIGVSQRALVKVDVMNPEGGTCPE
ncbi:hypothetical protein [Pseudomonas baetica]|uniref:hypothetical protein n=1 Tax=Pseudomonas baetica TaxID=674054 RepID=UPI0028718E73|nr:hypothetical protein [Pseudomonas baetica]MDR9863618.1 hypothetical protein [Pseudomonas baetica]